MSVPSPDDPENKVHVYQILTKSARDVLVETVNTPARSQLVWSVQRFEPRYDLEEVPKPGHAPIEVYAFEDPRYVDARRIFGHQITNTRTYLQWTAADSGKSDHGEFVVLHSPERFQWRCQGHETDMACYKMPNVNRCQDFLSLQYD